MTARDQARRWLAEVIHAAGHANTWRADWIADAILDAEHVEVETAYEHDPTGPRIAILIPAQPAQDGRTSVDASDGTQAPGGPISAGRIAQRLATFANDPEWLIGWLTAHGLTATAGPAAVINALANDWQSWTITHPDGRDAPNQDDHTPDQH